MSDFRKSQNEAHPNKTNTLLTGIILLQILFISMQVWFLFGALNNALEENFNFAVTTFVGSAIMAFFAIWILRYLPEPLKKGATRKPVVTASRTPD